MDCFDTQTLLHGYIDGELDLVNTVALEAHLRDCPMCSRKYKNQQTLRNAIRTSSLYVSAPAGLQQRIQSSVRKANKVSTTRSIPTRYWFGFAAVALVVLLALSLGRIWTTPPVDDQLAQEVLSSHLRSLMADHLADVASTDQHTVKPWFDGKLDFSPPVTDFSAQGFPLAGGRLDFLDNQPVAALVYKRRLHIINLFVWPTTQATTNPTTTTHEGYNIIRWTGGGMTFWAVSDLNTSELQEFVHLVQGQAGSYGPTSAPGR